MLRDPRRYPEPDKFIPERWLPGPGKEVPLEANKMAFGFGRRCVNNDLLFPFLLDIDYDWVWGLRRICPGRFFAENSVSSIIRGSASVNEGSMPRLWTP